MSRRLALAIAGVVTTLFLIEDSLETQSHTNEVGYWLAALASAVISLCAFRGIALQQVKRADGQKLPARTQVLVVAAVIAGTIASRTIAGTAVAPLISGAVGGGITSFLVWSPQLNRGRARD